MKISPFQALTILAKKYRNSLPGSCNAEKMSQVQSLFLMGVQSDMDRNALHKLFNDEALSKYEIALGDKEVINNDPVRRYYESTLALETLKVTIDSLDRETLDNHFRSVYDEMPLSMRFLVPITIYRGSIDSLATIASTTAPEYIAAIKKLQHSESWSFLKPTSEELNGATNEEQERGLKKRLDKLSVLVKTVHAAMTAVNTGGNENFPLNINGIKDSPYTPELRGRTPRTDESNLPQEVLSNNLGIMRSYHPLSQDDPLYENPDNPASGLYRRPADIATYVAGAQMPEKFFSTEVSPFVNSISGTMLCQLKVMAKLLEKDKFVFDDNPDQLKAFFKSMVSYMIFNSGGHSLQEFMSVLNLQEVQDMFGEIQGFDQIDLKTLFQDENTAAFHSAMESVIKYNDIILLRNTLQDELSGQKLDRELQENEDELTARARSRLNAVNVHSNAITSLDRKNQSIDKAYSAYTTQRDERNETVEEYVKRVQDAENILVEKLDIKNDIHQLKAFTIDKRIFIKMAMRQEELREHLFSSTGTLPQRLDYAYAIYRNPEKTEDDRLIAQSFLIYVFDINPETTQGSLADAIGKLMLERELLKGVNPDYIPGKSPIALDETTKAKLQATREPHNSESEEVNRNFISKDLLDVNPLSKRKDKGELTGRKTEFFTEQERDMLRVLISKGKFVQNGNLLDTSECFSHDKKGFAAFTLNVNGELSVFQHIDHDKTGIAHSSMNNGAPVVGAGEVRIEKGKLISITDHSGHYRPSLYNTYKILEYFKKQGIDINGVKVLTLANPSGLNILNSNSKEFARFNEINAEDLCDGYKAHLRATIVTAIQDLNKYQSPSILTMIYYIKDFLMGTTAQKDRIAFAKSLVADLTSLNAELTDSQTPEEIQKFGEKLKNNFLISSVSGLTHASGRLGNKLKFFSEQIKDVTEEYTDEEYISSLKGIQRN